MSVVFLAPGRWPRAVSLLLAGAVLVLAVIHPDSLGTEGRIIDRAFGALMLVGTVGATLDALHWQSERRHIRLLMDRRFIWPAILAGATWGLIAA